jgi:hypothetical protein
LPFLCARAHLYIYSTYDFYKANIADLQGTGSGIKDDTGELYYMPALRPDEKTPEQARNIWCTYRLVPAKQKLTDLLLLEEKECLNPVFPRLHALLSMKPKAVPPAITTGIGPCGAEVRHLQAPSRGDLAIEATYSSRVPEDNTFADETIDPALQAMSLPQLGPTLPETTPSEPATPRRRSVPA